MDKISSALDRYQSIMERVEAQLGNFRKIRYQSILNNLQNFRQIQAENDALIQQVTSWQQSQAKPQVPTVKIS